MAIMIPSIPQDFIPASGEDKVFYALRNLPGDPNDKGNEYYVFHSFKINRVNEEKVLERNEIDFVIFHPEKGILCLEVKNGKVMSENREWYFAKEEKNGVLKKKKLMPHGGPFRQAENRKEDLLKEISKANIFLYGDKEKKLKDHCKVLFAVCLSGVESSEEGYTIEKEENKEKKTIGLKFNDFLRSSEYIPELVIFGEDLRSQIKLKEKIDNIFKIETKKNGEIIETGNNGKRLHDKDRKQLFDKVLCPNFHIVEMVDDDGEPKYIALNNEQQNVFKIIRENDWKEAAIRGMAGTGKTVLALLLAKEKAANGRVLYLCINHMLRQEMEKNYSNNNIEFTDIDLICEQWLNLKDGGAEHIDEKTIREILRKKIEDGKKPYQTVIVDEGQDFGEGIKFDILYNLYCVIREKEPGWEKKEIDDDTVINELNNSKRSFYIFYDERQKNDEARVPGFVNYLEQKVALKIICRNSPNIAMTALKPKFNLPEELCQRISFGNGANKVKMNFFNDADEMKALLEKVIDEISKKDNDTVILTCKNDWSEKTGEEDESELTQFNDCFVNEKGEPIKNFHVKNLITYYKTKSNKRILFTSWEKFKGLDKKNVILIDFDPDRFFIEGNDAYHRNFYVGVTRARDCCYILAQNYTYSEGFEATDKIRMAELFYEMRCKQRKQFDESGIRGDIPYAGVVEDFWGALIYAFEKRKDSTMTFTKFWSEFCSSGKQERKGWGMGYILKHPEFAEELEAMLEESNRNEGKIVLAEPVAYAIGNMDFFDSIKHDSVKENSVHKKLNNDFLKEFNKVRHKSYRDAICRALNAENLYSEDNESK